MFRTTFSGAAFGAALLALTAGLPGSALAQQGRVACGGVYTVQPGDTLRGVALRAYDRGIYEIIFEANRGVLTDPELLLVGQRIFIPCIDGSQVTGGQAIRRDLRTAAEAPSTVRVAARRTAGAEGFGESSLGKEIRFLTGSNYAPFTGRGLPEGGMATEIVNRAMINADLTRRYDITWENDWDRHLGVLSEGEQDLGFPWFRPACNQPSRLSPEMRQRCSQFEFSLPIYEVQIGYYMTAANDPGGPITHADLAGKHLCRPERHFTFDLEAHGLMPPNVVMTRPATAGDCFALLSEGLVDVVVMSAALAEAEIAARGDGDRVAELRELAGAETLHVVAAKSNPAARDYLALIDDGLSKMRGNGEWGEIVARHIDWHTHQAH